MKTYMKILKIDKISFRDLIFDEIWEFFEEARETRPFELRSSRRMKSVEIDQRQRQPRNVFWCAILFFATFAIFYAKKQKSSLTFGDQTSMNFFVFWWWWWNECSKFPRIKRFFIKFCLLILQKKQWIMKMYAFNFY
jgi:hypothetical protein